jgi:hypothetical protein
MDSMKLIPFFPKKKQLQIPNIDNKALLQSITSSFYSLKPRKKNRMILRGKGMLQPGVFLLDCINLGILVKRILLRKK